MKCVRLHPSATIIQSDQGILLHGSSGTFLLEGRDAESTAKMLPLMDGSRTPDDIAADFPNFSASSIFTVLESLIRYGIAEEVTPEHHSLEHCHARQWRQFLALLTPDVEAAIQKLRNARVLLAGLSQVGVVAASELALAGIAKLHLVDDEGMQSENPALIDLWNVKHQGATRAEALTQLLHTTAPKVEVLAFSSLGELSSLDSGSTHRWDLVVTAEAPNDFVQRAAIARFAHAHHLTSLYGCLEGSIVRLGPLTVPGKTACWNCCRLRLIANSESPNLRYTLEQKLLRDAPAQQWPELGSAASIAGHLLALHAIQAITGFEHFPLLGSLMFLNLATLESEIDHVIPMPWCVVCGGAEHLFSDESSPEPLLPSMAPAELRRRLRGWINARTGVISRLLVRGADGDSGALPFCSVAALSAFADDEHPPSACEFGYGKGLTESEATLGGIGEALERYCASRFRLSRLRRLALNDLGEDDVLDPRSLCLYSEDQYRQTGFPFQQFDPAVPLCWVRGYWLNGGAPVWVPALPTYMGLPTTPEGLFCQVTSNGLAAGATQEDAALRAVFEIVERDALMLTWLCRLPGRRLITDEPLEPGLQDILDQIGQRGAPIEFYLLDVGSGIPTLICLAFGNGRTWPGVTAGCGANLSVRKALRAAIIEQGQTGPYLARIAKEQPELVPPSPQHVQTFRQHALFYAPAERAGSLDFLRRGDQEPILLSTIREPDITGLQACVDQLSGAGLRVAIVDITSPDVARIPMRVVRALGPSLQPIHCGFGLERLANPRLDALKRGELNCDIHPFC